MAATTVVPMRAALSLLQPAVLLLCLCVATTKTTALSQDGILLLSFKLSLTADPLGTLSGWGYTDATPCSWNGVACSPDDRVVSVVLPNAQLVGPVARELGFIEQLRRLDLSGNALSGGIPADLMRAAELRVLSLAGNGLTGGLPEQVGQLRGLRALDLAGNALSGPVPRGLLTGALPNLTAVSLAGNFFSGPLPAGGGLALAPALHFLDFSGNLLNGTLPPDLLAGGAALRYVNLSRNRIEGGIPEGMAARVPANVTIDLSYNNLTGAIPAVPPFSTQEPAAFEGNPGLCGRPLVDRPCSSSSSPSPSPAVKPTPAIAAIPKEEPTGGTTDDAAATSGGGQGRRTMRVLAIAAGDVAGVAALSLLAFYVYYQLRKRRRQRGSQDDDKTGVVFKKPMPEPEDSEPEPDTVLSCCLRNNKDKEDSSSSDDDTEQKGVVVTVDGGAALRLETLLKASAYILGSASRSIVYKAVLADGAALAVRRIGSDAAAVRRFADLDAHMRAVARARHANVLRLRGFYWGPDEVLVIHELAPNGSLASALKTNLLGWGARLRVALDVARGLAFLHHKKWVHGNVKPSNVLFDAGMEPLVADLGVDRLIFPDDLSNTRADGCYQYYRAPEKQRSAKWDVYSFGVLLMELVAGRALTELEILRIGMAEPALEAREDAAATCLRLAAACCAAAPGKRPSMRDVLQAIDRIPLQHQREQA